VSRLSDDQKSQVNGNGDHFQVAEPPPAVYDALADLFLGNDEPNHDATDRRQSGATNPAATHATATGVIEALVLGHLPVLASAWVTQYARRRTTDGRPVALVRIANGTASLDLFGAPEPPHPGSTLADAITAAATLDPHWLIRVDEPDEPRLLEADGVDRVTLLTGADQAAVIASYRALKSIAAVENDQGARPHVAVTIVGSDDKHANGAAAKLTGAARTFLGRDLTITATIPHITPGRAHTLHQGPAPEDVSRLVRAIAQARHHAGAGPERLEAPGEGAEPTPHDGREAEPMPEVVVPTHAPPPPQQTRPTPATPAPNADACRAIGDLRKIRPHCPYHPEIELAAGADGTLHLVARADDEARMGEAVTKLVATRAWAGLHHHLLAIAEPALATAGDRPPTVHLVTTNARAARRLLDTDVRVHALAPDGRGAAIALN